MENMVWDGTMGISSPNGRLLAMLDNPPIGTSSKRPSKKRLAAKYRSQGDAIALVSKDAVKLHSCCFVVLLHLLFNNLLDFRSHLRRLTRSNASVDVASILKFLDKLRYAHPAALKALFVQQLRNGRRFVAFTIVY